MPRENGTYPYETLIRHTPGGLAISHRTVTVLDGREYISDPMPLTGEGITALDDDALKTLAESFSAMLADDMKTAETAVATIPTLQSTITEIEAARDAVQAQLDAILNPPDGIYPYQFQRLLTDAQLVAIQLSVDATLIRMRTDVQTIVSPMPFGEGSNLRNGVMYLGYVLPELFTQEEVTRILNRQQPV